VFYLLEEWFTVWLVNARDVKKVPGRKTDVKDAQWLAQLAAHGLVTPSFVPPPPIRRLRDLTRARANLTRERVRALNRLETVLEDAGIKMSTVLSRTLTMSGRLMIEALIAGKRDPAALADLALGKVRPKVTVLRGALAGRFTDHHAFLARQALRHIDWLDAEITELGERIDAEMGPLAPKRALLETIPGVGERISAVILAELGSPSALLRRGPLRTVHAIRHRTRLKQASGTLRVCAGILRLRAWSSRRQEAWIKRVWFPSGLPRPSWWTR
jgi:transposase